MWYYLPPKWVSAIIEFIRKHPLISLDILLLILIICLVIFR
jgi:hypothetical protein